MWLPDIQMRREVWSRSAPVVRRSYALVYRDDEGEPVCQKRKAALPELSTPPAVLLDILKLIFSSASFRWIQATSGWIRILHPAPALRFPIGPDVDD